jgi:alpha-tubulin suppressor-like RCC1 family protein
MIEAKDKFSLALYDNGDLFSWGNSSSPLGYKIIKKNISTKPKKIMCNIKYISASSDFVLAIDNYNYLWMWNIDNTINYGFGNKKNISNEPKRIMKDVKSVSSGNIHIVALKQNGDLYTFGRGMFGTLGSKDYMDLYYPQKVMTDVKSIDSSGYITTAIKTNGDLYVWGSVLHDSKNYSNIKCTPKPIKIAEKIKKVNCENAIYAYDYKNKIHKFSNKEGKFIDEIKENWGTDVEEIIYSEPMFLIKKDGKLYGWGVDKYNITKDHLNMNKILDNVDKVSTCLGNSHTCKTHTLILTKNGELYGYGDNTSGQLIYGENKIISKVSKLRDS